MSGKKEDGDVEVTCPVCKATVRVPVREAEEKMTVRCPKGHEVPLVKMM